VSDRYAELVSRLKAAAQERPSPKQRRRAGELLRGWPRAPGQAAQARGSARPRSIGLAKQSDNYG